MLKVSVRVELGSLSLQQVVFWATDGCRCWRHVSNLSCSESLGRSCTPTCRELLLLCGKFVLRRESWKGKAPLLFRAISFRPNRPMRSYMTVLYNLINFVHVHHSTLDQMEAAVFIQLFQCPSEDLAFSSSSCSTEPWGEADEDAFAWLIQRSQRTTSSCV